MKTTKLKRTVAAALAVVTISLTFFSYFRLTAHAGNSLSHIEEIKSYQQMTGAGYKIVEIAPAEDQGSMGYYVKGSEPPLVGRFLDVLANINSPVGRETYNAFIETKLGPSGHNLIGTGYSPSYSVPYHYPIVSNNPYSEQYPWASGNAGNDSFPGPYDNELQLNNIEEFTANGYMTEVAEGEGDYRASLTHRLPSFNYNIFDFEDFKDKCTVIEGDNGYGYSIGVDPDQEYVKTNCGSGFTVFNEDEDGFIFKSGPGCIHQTDIYFESYNDALAIDVTPGRTYYFNYRVRVIDEGAEGLEGPRSSMRVVGANASLSGYATYFYEQKLENVDGEGNIYYTSHTLEVSDEYYTHKPTVPVGEYEDVSVCITAGPEMEYMYFNYGYKGNGTIEIRSLTIGESTEPVDYVQDIKYFKKDVPTEIKGDNLINFDAYVDNPLSGRLSGGSAGDSVTFNRIEKTATIVTDDIGSIYNPASFDIYTDHHNRNAYFMNAKPNTTYEFSFDIEVTSGAAQVHVFQIRQNFTNCANWANVNSRHITPAKAEQLGNKVVLRFTTDADCRYINFRIGTDAASTNAVYSNFALNEIIQPKAYFYAVSSTPFILPVRYDGEEEQAFLARLEAFKKANNGKAIYIFNTDIDGYEYVDTYDTEDPRKPQGIKGGFKPGVDYFTLSIKKGTYPSPTQEGENQYCAMYGNRPSPYFHKYTALDEAGPFFVQVVDYYEYLGKNLGNFKFTYNSGQTVKIMSKIIYYRGGYTNTSIFERFVFDCGQTEGIPYALTETVNASVTTITPGNLNNPQNRRLLESADLIVFSTGVNTGYQELKFAAGDDLSDDDQIQTIIRNHITIEKMPVVVDTDLFTNIVDTPPNLRALLLEICEGKETGGVSGSVYRFSKADGGSYINNLANIGILRPIANVNDYTGPYGLVGEEIQNESNFRGNNSLPNQYINQASCMRYIINYANQQLYFIPDTIKVLDIEPYTSNPSLTEEMVRMWLPENNAGFANTDIEIDCMAVVEFNCRSNEWLQKYDVIYIGTSTENMNVVPYWRCECGFVNGIDYATCQKTNCSKSRNEAFQRAYSKDRKDFSGVKYSTIKSGGFSRQDDKVYDDIDFRWSKLEYDYAQNYSSSADLPSIKPGSPIYNDPSMNGLYYTNTGDLLTTANKKSIERPELCGLLREDYMRFDENLTGIGFIDNLLQGSYIALGGKSVMRSSGNDLNAAAVKKLEDFINSGRLCVLSSDLTTGTSVTSVIPVVEIDPLKTKHSSREYEVAFMIKFADDPDTAIDEALEMEGYSFKENFSEQQWQFRPQAWIDANGPLIQREQDANAYQVAMAKNGNAEGLPVVVLTPEEIAALSNSWVNLPSNWNTITQSELDADSNNYRYFKVKMKTQKVTNEGLVSANLYVCNSCYYQTSENLNGQTCPECGTTSATFTIDPYRPNSFFNYTVDAEFVGDKSTFSTEWATKHPGIPETTLGEYRCVFKFKHQGVVDNLKTNGCTIKTKDLDFIFRLESGECSVKSGASVDPETGLVDPVTGVERVYSSEKYYLSFWKYTGGSTWQTATYERTNLPEDIDLQCMWFYRSTSWVCDDEQNFSVPVADIYGANQIYPNIFYDKVNQIAPSRAYTSYYAGSSRVCGLMNIALRGTANYQDAFDKRDSDFNEFGTFQFMKKYGVPQYHTYGHYSGPGLDLFYSDSCQIRNRYAAAGLFDGFNTEAHKAFMYFLHKPGEGNNYYSPRYERTFSDMNGDGSRRWAYLYGDLSVEPTGLRSKTCALDGRTQRRYNVVDNVNLYWRITILDPRGSSTPRNNITPVPSWLKLDRVDNASQMWNFISNNFYKKICSRVEGSAATIDTFCDENDNVNFRDTNLVGCLQYSKADIFFITNPKEYPQDLGSDSITLDFVIVDKNNYTTGERNTNYKATLFVDANRDGKFEEALSPGEYTDLEVSEEITSYNGNSDLRHTLTWDLSGTEKGIIPWMLVLNETTEYSDGRPKGYVFKTGYAYKKPGNSPEERINIKALMILPGDWGMEYKVKTDPDTYSENEYLGNAFLGEGFHNIDGLEYITDGDGTIYTGDKKDYYPNGIFTGADGLEHMGFNVNNGEIVIDIACISIYEMNTNPEWFPVPADSDDNESWFLADNADSRLFNYNLLILGFGDSWAKLQYNQYIATMVGGLNKRSANAIRAYIEAGGATLFCHDSTNKEVNFINYFLNEDASWGIETLNGWAKWWNNLIGNHYPSLMLPTTDRQLADSKTKQGWWGNYMLRNVLGLDRYGITYAIRTRAEAISSGEDRNPYNEYARGKPVYSTEVIGRAHQYDAIYNYYELVNNTNAPIADRLRLEEMQREIIDDPNTDEYEFKIPYTITWLPNRAMVFESANPEADGIGWTLEDAHDYVEDKTGSDRIYDNKGYSLARDGKIYNEKGEFINYSYRNGVLYKGAYPAPAGEVNPFGALPVFEGMPVYAVHGSLQGDKKDLAYTDLDDATEEAGMTVPGNQYDRYGQGFTNFTISRYASPRDEHKNQFFPTRQLNSIFRVQNYQDPIRTNNITQVNEGQINTYPFNIKVTDLNFMIPIHTTHDQVYQCNTNGDDVTIWYCMADDKYCSINDDGSVSGIRNDCLNAYYIYSRGNVMYTGAGHTNVLEGFEAKLFLNTVVAAYSNAPVIPCGNFIDNIEERDENGNLHKLTNKGSKSYIFIEEMKDDEGAKYLQAMSNVYFSILDNNYAYPSRNVYAELYYIDPDTGDKVKLENKITLIKYTTTNSYDHSGENTQIITGTSEHSNTGSLTYADGTTVTAYKNLRWDTTYGFELPDEILQKFEDDEELTSLTICIRPTTFIPIADYGYQEGPVTRLVVRRVVLSDLA